MEVLRVVTNLFAYEVTLLAFTNIIKFTSLIVSNYEFPCALMLEDLVAKPSGTASKKT